MAHLVKSKNAAIWVRYTSTGPLREGGRVIVDQATVEKVVIMSHYVLQHVFGIPTPLGIATAYLIFNQTPSKSLVLNHRIEIGISYERFHCQLTTQSVKVMQQIETGGVYSQRS